MSFYPGLVSISFRRYSVDDILDACQKAGLTCIEWGSDVHVPVGQLENAINVGNKNSHHNGFTLSWPTTSMITSYSPATISITANK